MRRTTFLLAMCFMLINGEAPEDFHDICRTDYRYRTVHDWIPYVNNTSDGVRGAVKWQILVDQNDYQHILGDTIPPGVWMRRDVDGDTRQFSQSGSVCTNSLMIRNTYQNPDSNNWVFTQLVNYLNAIEVIVNATVRFRGCQQRSNQNPPCRNNFVTLYRYDTNSSRSPNQITNTNNYQPCFRGEVDSRLEPSTTDGDAIVIKRFLRPSFSSTYFGIRDIGSYGDVIRILVYYRVAQGYEQGLVVCPSVALPEERSDNTNSKDCTCKSNATAVTSLERKCRGNGVCEEDPFCACNPGYQYNKTLGACEACPVGTYKPDISNTTQCLPCPVNSTAVNVSTTVCECICGTIRDPSKPGDPCQSIESFLLSRQGEKTGEKPGEAEVRRGEAEVIAITFFATIIPTVVITSLVVFLVMWFLCVKSDAKRPEKTPKKATINDYKYSLK